MSDTLSSKRIAGTDLLVRDGAPHDTVFLLHGIGGRAHSFAELMRRWPRGRRLVAWDMPGYGGSQPHSHAWPLPDDYADRLFEICEALHLDTVDVMGQSLGALIAACFAHLHAGIIRRLVLMSPALGYKVQRGGTLPDALARRITDFDREGAAGFAETRAQRLVHQPEQKPAVVDAVRAAMATLTTSSHTQAVRLLASGDLLADVQKINCRTLVINGADDVVTPIQGAEQVLARLKDRGTFFRSHDRLIFIQDAGHAVYLEQPDEVPRIVQEFLGEAG